MSSTSSQNTGIHRQLLEQSVPVWLQQASTQRRSALKGSTGTLPDWYSNAAAAQRKRLDQACKQSFVSQSALDRRMATLQDIDTFATPLLHKALTDQGVTADLSSTFLTLRRALAMGDLEVELGAFEVLKLPLLQAALHNFEAGECEPDAFHRTSGFSVRQASGAFEPQRLAMTVSEFLSLCRQLDIGAQYQRYLEAFFEREDSKPEACLRDVFIASQKDALRAAAESALLKQDILLADYTMILSVIDGQRQPSVSGKPVWFRDLSLMNRRMTGCIWFGICEQYRYSDELILYVPHDPDHPLKRYRLAELRETFKRQFTARAGEPSDGAQPTAYQQFFSRFVAYAERPYYFSQFRRKAATAPADPLRSPWFTVMQQIPPYSRVLRIKALPPERVGAYEPVDDPYLNPVGTTRSDRGIWAENPDLWAYLYECHRDRLLADARSHAVPTADVDASVRARKLEHLLDLGLLALNAVSLFVPVLGEIMLTVMAGQLLYESFEGAIEWSEGDRRAARAHLIDVAENLAQIAVMAGAGKGLARMAAIKPEPVIEALEPLVRADGHTRLGKPGLGAYEQDGVLDEAAQPDAQGQYLIGDKRYIRMGGKVYETAFDASLKKWRIRHPTDKDAWQPVLAHNGEGAWRHVLERPLSWDRLTLLRRLGHLTDAFDDTQLLAMADASGTEDGALRKVHVDRLPVPAQLSDLLHSFESARVQAPADLSGPAQDLVGLLQRRCPGLGVRAARRLLVNADAQEWARLQRTRRVPLRLMEEARWHVRQGRFSHAVADLHRDSPVLSDSRWLALHALQSLPGWTADCRLEVREGSVHGRLLDAIGSQTARPRILVKNGPFHQAFDEGGEALERPFRREDNFYSSLLLALPDSTRSALDLPSDIPAARLRQRLVAQVVDQRPAMIQAFERRTGARQSFKPPVRVRAEQSGYYASGRGQGLNPSLVTRVRDVYPNLTDELAEGLILELLRSGKNDAQIHGLLQTRLREWQALEATLDEWVGQSTPDTFLHSMMGGRVSVAEKLKQCWRNAPLGQQGGDFSRLDLTCDDPIPPLPADFSHVRELVVWGRCITNANADALLNLFPNLRYLRINATSQAFDNVPAALEKMSGLRELSMYLDHPFSAQVPAQLATLTSLETLRVLSMSHQSPQLDVTALHNLKTLEIVAYSMHEMPEGVSSSPRLERLILKDTAINRLPEAFYPGQDRLWRGLSVDWSKFEREHFKPAYERVRGLPGDSAQSQEMLRDYCKGELRRLLAESGGHADAMIDGFLSQWPEESARLTAIERLSEQASALERQLDPWVQQALQQWETLQEGMARAVFANKVKVCWRKGLYKRYGVPTDGAMLDLSGTSLQSLPVLPVDAFPHVRTLLLNGLNVPAEQLRVFAGAFADVRTLDLSGNGLTEIPIVPGSYSPLTYLNLSGNRIAGEIGRPALKGFAAMEYLDLSDNPLTAVDVSDMGELRALSLRGTALQTWPVAAHTLAQLLWLDLGNTALSTLPEVALQSDILLNTELTGAPLTPQALEAIAASRSRIEQSHGLLPGTLARFAEAYEPSAFPPYESGSTLARRLLPLPARWTGEEAGGFSQRLSALDPQLSPTQASALVERWRESGLADEQIAQRIAEHESTLDNLIQRLNSWLFVHSSHGEGWTISADSRRVAASRILACWQDGIFETDIDAELALDFNGLQIGDLPELPAVFSHVRTLDLTGVRLTAEGAERFLGHFDQLQRLSLSGNGLSTLPQALQRMSNLERLDLSSNDLSDPYPLYPTLTNLARLNWLDMGYNDLQTFDVSDFQGLNSLDLRINNLTEWPDGALDNPALRSLNLSGNDIMSLPSDALEPRHAALIAGTDLSDNLNLSHETLRQIQAYRDAAGHSTVLGISAEELDQMVETASGRSDEETDSFASDEVLADDPPDVDQSTPWLSHSTPERATVQAALWKQVAAEPGSTAFFHLLARLQDSREFQVAHADLSRRVWLVMEAIADNSELREVVFASASTHGTCVDGRLLTFSGIESKVFVHTAITQWPVAGQPGKGRMLLDLSRQLFRLDRVDELATRAATASRRDEAEVRLGYRIGLTGGWSDGLVLPGQPHNMTYSSGVTPRQLAQARAEVVAAESGDAFLADLIQRDYWVDYLKVGYPQAFSELDAAENLEGSEDEVQGADDPALITKLFDLAAARNARMIELSRQEIARIDSASPRPDPSTRT